MSSTFGREDAYFWVVPANASGKWIWTEGKGSAKVRWEMELKQVFQEFSGQISRNGRPFPLRGGKIKGDEIRFSLDGDPADKPSTLVFTGRIRGNTIEGDHCCRNGTPNLEGHPQPRHDAADRPLTCRCATGQGQQPTVYSLQKKGRVDRRNLLAVGCWLLAVGLLACYLFTQTLLLLRFLTMTPAGSRRTKASAAAGYFTAPTMGVSPHLTAVFSDSCSAIKAAAGGDTR